MSLVNSCCVAALLTCKYTIMLSFFNPIYLFKTPTSSIEPCAGRAADNLWASVILYPPIRLSVGMNKFIPPDSFDRYRVSPLKLKLDIKRKILMQRQCIVSGRSCGPSPYIFGIYLFFSGPQFEKSGSENLEQSLYLCIL